MKPDSVVRYHQIKPISACRYDGIALGEVMLRFDPFDVPMSGARLLRVWQGGGETNVACGLAHTFGLRSAVLTALVDDHIGRNINQQLQGAGVDTSWIIWFNTDNDGSRFSTDKKGSLMNGVNFTYTGKGLIPSDTLYYRAHSAVRELRPGDFNLENLLGQAGVRVFSTGGIFTLLSETSWQLALEIIEQANLHGTFVAADLNYRSKVQPNKAIASEINQRIAPLLGFLVGNDHDMEDALGYRTEVDDTADFYSWLPAYQNTVRRVAHDFPNLSLIGTQWRGRHNADMVSWGAVLYDTQADQFYVAPLRENIPIKDRTGGGDSYLSGVLAALLKGKDLQTAVEWGAAHGLLVQELPGDITMIDEKLVVKEVARARQGGGIEASR
jgi:2-dehydro-3-deoxygluconokinase